MFRFHKPLDIITLFHKPSLTTSTRALNLLKQASAIASEASTADKASSHAQHPQRSQFDFNITEDPPTPDQLKIIMDYMEQGKGLKVGELVEGARDRVDAIRRVKEDGERFKRPVVVDWNNGKAVLGTDESEILKLLREEPPEH